MASSYKRYAYLAAVACVLAVLFSATSLRAAELDVARDAVRAASSGGSSSGGGSYNGHDCDDGSFVGDLVGALISGMLEGMFCDRHHANDCDTYDDSPVYDSLALCFPHYPYQRDWDGYMLPPGTPEMRIKSTALRTYFDYGSDFDDITRWRGGLLYETVSSGGFEFEWNSYIEQPSVGPSDTLNVGEFNWLWRIGSGQHAQMRWGLGLTWLNDATDDDLGYNLTAKLDFYPAKPVVISWDFDYGQIGETHMSHISVSLGVLWKRSEFFTGYDYRRIGNADLHGPMFGVRFWF